jgi:rsbT antagonist protein RsbS
VPAIDTQTAQYLIETVSAVKLIGAQVILTGIRPVIAQALVHLGIDLSGIYTRSSLAGGVRTALEILNLPDDLTISILQEKVLYSMETFKAKGLVLDISAVETFDSFFARVVAETAQMVVLMGGKTVIAGMQPSVAITATQLGLTLGGAQTALNADFALEILSDFFKQGV